MSKSSFLERSRLQESPSGELSSSFPEAMLEGIDPAILSECIWVGKEITIPAGDDCRSLFVITSSGMVSNEVFFGSDVAHYEVELSVKGGWKTAGCPVLRIL